jgi:hypothetical protein
MLDEIGRAHSIKTSEDMQFLPEWDGFVRSGMNQWRRRKRKRRQTLKCVK